MIPAPPTSTLFPYTTLFRSVPREVPGTSIVISRGPRLRSLLRSIGLRSRVRVPLSRPYSRSRSEEHTSELQSRVDLVCRLLLEKKNKNYGPPIDFNDL